MGYIEEEHLICFQTLDEGIKEKSEDVVRENNKELYFDLKISK